MEEVSQKLKTEAPLDYVAMDDLFATTEKGVDNMLNLSLDEVGLDDVIDLGLAEETPKKAPKKKALDNAERCRRHRAKQREEAQKVYKQNSKLKRERTELLKKIADLQNEVQCLRGEGAVDFTLENALLKAEIKKHRRYVETVVKLSKLGPMVSQEEENIRVMKSGVESGVGHVVGLLYSSMSSDTWKEGVPLSFKLHFPDGRTTEIPVQLWYQYLPLGSSPSTYHRINLRMHYHDFPVPAKAIENICKTIMMDTAFVKRITKEHHPEVELDELIPTQLLEGGETLGCHRIKVLIDGVQHEDVVASSFKSVELFPAAFPEHFNINEPKTLSVSVQASCNLDVETQEGHQRVTEITSKGSVLIPTAPDKTTIVAVASMPRSNGMLDVHIKRGEPLVSDNGELAASIVDMMEKQWSAILFHAFAGKESSEQNAAET